jgi:hypothetical protein
MGAVWEAAGKPAEEGVAAAREARFVVGLSGPVVAAWHAPILAVASRQPIAGITLGRTIYLVDSRSLEHWPLVVHETVHVAQVLRLGTPRFLAAYATEWTGSLLRGRSPQEAYLGLSDEEEARHVESFSWSPGLPETPWFRKLAV